MTSKHTPYPAVSAEEEDPHLCMDWKKQFVFTAVLLTAENSYNIVESAFN
jgi:hypothetical protein